MKLKLKISYFNNLLFKILINYFFNNSGNYTNNQIQNSETFLYHLTFSLYNLLKKKKHKQTFYS